MIFLYFCPSLVSSRGEIANQSVDVSVLQLQQGSGSLDCSYNWFCLDRLAEQIELMQVFPRLCDRMFERDDKEDELPKTTSYLEGLNPKIALDTPFRFGAEASTR